MPDEEIQGFINYFGEDNIPNPEILEQNLNKPLTSIPDPFKKYSSFGEHNNEMLKSFLEYLLIVQ